MKSIFKHAVVRILTWEAKAVLRRHKPKIIAVTGSVGKTSTKDAIYAAISSKLHVRKSEKSFNSELGVPLTILGLPNGWLNPLIWASNIVRGLGLIVFKTRYPEWLVLEVGADAPGDIRSITEWVKPDISVITKLSEVPVHVENFASPLAVIEEKAYLARALKREGTLILNSDDENVMMFREYAPDNKVVSYGFKGADVLGSDCQIAYDKEGKREVPRGVNFRVDAMGSSVPVYVYGSLGRSHVYPALAALAVGFELGLNAIDMAEALGKHRGPRGRMKILPGLKNSTIIDDTYNSSPVASHQALDTLAEVRTEGRKIAVLGDMLELGRFGMEEHKKVGEHAAKAADILMTVGVLSRYIAEGALAAGMDESAVFQYDDSARAGKELEQKLAEGDIALIKGSQRTRMERAVLEVMAEPSKAEELLVRQDAEWARKA